MCLHVRVGCVFRCVFRCVLDAFRVRLDPFGDPFWIRFGIRFGSVPAPNAYFSCVLRDHQTHPKRTKNAISYRPSNTSPNASENAYLEI